MNQSDKHSTLTTVLCGSIHQETIIDKIDRLSLRSPGGHLLYAASGHALFNKNIGLVSKVNPEEIQEIEKYLVNTNFDLSGIKPVKHGVNSSRFYRINGTKEYATSNSKKHFYQIGREIPKYMLTHDHEEIERDHKLSPESTPITSDDFPPSYQKADTFIFCPMDFQAQYSTIPHLSRKGRTTFFIRTSESYMRPGFIHKIPSLLQGIQFLVTTEDEVKCLFHTRLSLFKEMLAQLLKFGAQKMIIKMNADHTLIIDQEGNMIKVPDYKVHTMDPIGEYDCFYGAFAANISMGKDLETSGGLAAAAASVCREGSGIRYILEAHFPIIEGRAHLLSYEISHSHVDELLI